MSNIKENIAEILDKVRETVPLVHNMTNYVTVNDVANAVLALGASPIMADDIGEVEDIVSISSALVLNIGTLNKRTITSMIKAGKKANELGIPVIFDPVGAGASTLRNNTAGKILEHVKVTVIRGNLSEMSFIAGLGASTKGVDSSAEDEGNDGVYIAKSVAKKFGCVAAITGKIDIISNGSKAIKIENGHPMLSKVTGTGCMTTALVGSCAGASGNYLEAAAAGILSMGISGELAYENEGATGTGSFHIAIIDALSNINGTVVLERSKIYEE